MHAVPDPDEAPRPSLRFSTAVDIAWRFARTVVGGHGLLQTTADGQIVQQVALDGPFTIDHAAGWALCYRANNPGWGSSLVLLSAGQDHVATGHGCTIACIEFEHARDWLRAQGIELHDWFLTDGSLVRSLAFSAHPEEAWPGEPNAVYATQRKQEDAGLVW